MKQLIILISIIGLIPEKPQSVNSLYLIKRVDSVNSWYVLYATRKDSSYKIVSKKVKHNASCQASASVGQYYDLDLHSNRSEAPTINGIKVSPANYLDVQCYSYDQQTNICIEPDKGIYDLYRASNLSGLCVLKRN